MISLENLAALREAAGPDGLVEHEPFDVGGIDLGLTLRPSTTEALSGVLAELGRQGCAAVVRGGGNRVGVCNLPRRADLVLSTERLQGIDELDRHDGVCRVRSGTPVAELRAAVRESGWELPIDSPGEGATIGGCVAAAAIGPRTHGYSRPRDRVLGLDVCLASGQQTRCGGRVVKNVTGYDLGKLYTGSFGTLGVIESAWLRLMPRPEREAVFALEFNDLASAGRLGVEIGRRSTSRVAAILLEHDVPARIVVELAGDEASVGRDAKWLVEECGARDADSHALDAVRGVQHDVPAPDGLRFRLGVLPSALPRALDQLDAAGARLLAYPGVAVVYARFVLPETESPERSRATDAAFATVAQVAGDDYVCEAAPVSVKHAREMFGGSQASKGLFEALKRRFDPAGVLNPGRFAGGI